MSLFAILTLGLFLGVRHATDVDHVVAVSTIVTRERTTLAAMRVGALWGIGHTVTILVVGGAIVIFGLVVPPNVEMCLELSVAVMLLVLGGVNIVSTFRHNHASPESPAPQSDWRTGRLRPLAVGTIHGLAGSAALALLVLTTIHEASRALLYLGVFGVGTVIGMMLLTALVAVPVAAAAQRFVSFERLLARVTGVSSIALGLFLAYRIGFGQ
jgi:cytochrome c biogenesis protein CcdA